MQFNSYIFMVIGIIFAKSIGFLRDIFFASQFGTSPESDMYFTVFSVVTLIFTGIGIALSTVIIKQLNKKQYSNSEIQTEYVSFFIKRIVLFLVLLCSAMYIFADNFTAFLIPGIAGENFNLALKITYIMIPSTAFVTIAYILYGVLQNKRVFFITSVMSVPYNILVIASLFIPNISIVFISLVTTIGWFTHILILMPDFYRKGYRFFKRSRKFSMPVREILWVFISNMMFQLCLMLDKSMVVSNSGMASCVNYSSNLFVTASSVFIVAMSSVTFPLLTKSYETKDLESVRNTFCNILSVMWAIFLPFLLVCLLFGKNIVSLLYERGEFTAQSTAMTATLFIIYSFAILGYLAEQIFNKILFLDGKYKYTVIGTTLVIVLKFILNLFLIPMYGAYSAALCTVSLMTGYGIFSLIKIKPIIGNYITPVLLQSFFKTTVAALSAIAVYIIFHLVFHVSLNSGAMFLLPLLTCGIIYIAVLFLTGEGKKLFMTLKK